MVAPASGASTVDPVSRSNPHGTKYPWVRHAVFRGSAIADTGSDSQQMAGCEMKRPPAFGTSNRVQSPTRRPVGEPTPCASTSRSSREVSRPASEGRGFFPHFLCRGSKKVGPAGSGKGKAERLRFKLPMGTGHWQRLRAARLHCREATRVDHFQRHAQRLTATERPNGNELLQEVPAWGPSGIHEDSSCAREA